MPKNMVLKKINIERHFPDDLKSYFVANVVVQHQADFFVLSFFEVWPPVIIGESEEEKQNALDSIDSLEAKCVARLVLTPDRMKELHQLITENLSSYEHLLQIIDESSRER